MKGSEVGVVSVEVLCIDGIRLPKRIIIPADCVIGIEALPQEASIKEKLEPRNSEIVRIVEAINAVGYSVRSIDPAIIDGQERGDAFHIEIHATPEQN